ncbi:MAG: TPM domain-containing protein [Oscillospiraceae bacterium]
MKFFQKRGVAIVVLILAIVASSAWGLHKAPVVSTPEGGEKLDPSLSTAAFTQYVRDEADILSDKTEEAVGLYNANWDKMFGSIMAVVTVQSSDNLENTAYDYADTMQLGSNDAILVIAKQQQDYYLVASGDFYDLLSSLSQSFVASCMADNVQKGDYDAAVRSLCAALHVELSQQYQQSEAALDEAANGVMFIMIVIIFFVLWIMLDGMRYRRYRRRYMMPGMGVPTVMYHPILLGAPSSARPTSAPFGRPAASAGRAETGAQRRLPAAVIAARQSRRDGPRARAVRLEALAAQVMASADSAAAGGGFGGSGRRLWRQPRRWLWLRRVAAAAPAAAGGGFGGGRSGGFGGGRGGGFGGRR